MSVQASIAVSIKADDKTNYNITLELGGAPTDPNPFIFDVVQEKKGAKAEDPPTTANLLELAVGASAGADTNLALSLSPPADLLQEATDSKLTKAAVEVSNGKKNFKDGKFV